MKVHATGVEEVAVVGVVAVSAALAALGICVAGAVATGDYDNMCQKIWDKTSENVRNQVTAAAVAGGAVYKLTTNFLSEVGRGVRIAYDYAMTQNALNSIPKDKLKSDSCSIYSVDLFRDVLGMQYPLVSSGNGWPRGYNTVISYSILGTLAIPMKDSVTTCTYGDRTISFRPYSSWGSGFPYTINNGSQSYLRFIVMNSVAFGYVVALRFKADPGYIYYILISTAQASTVGASSDFNVFELGAEKSTAAIPEAPGRDVIDINIDKWYATGASILNNLVDDVVGRLGDAVGVKQGDGTIRIPIPIPADKLKTGDQSRTQEKATGTDIATTEDREKNTETNKDKDTSLPKPPGLPDLSLPEVLFKDKFPFCLPWDLYLAFSNLAAPPQPPKWVIPFTIEKLNYRQNITIDFAQFSTLAVVLRWGLSVIFVIWLIIITRKMIGQGG